MKWEMRLQAGDRGVDDTVAFMSEFTRKYTGHRQVIEELRSNDLVDIRDKDKTIKNIYDYFANLYTYKPDPEGIELIRSPKWTILNGERWGDCDDLSCALATYLRTAGVDCKFRTGAWKKETGNAFTHVWLLAKGKRGYVPLDPSAGKNGYLKEVNWHRKKDYNI